MHLNNPPFPHLHRGRVTEIAMFRGLVFKVSLLHIQTPSRLDHQHPGGFKQHAPQNYGAPQLKQRPILAGTLPYSAGSNG